MGFRAWFSSKQDEDEEFTRLHECSQTFPGRSSVLLDQIRLMIEQPSGTIPYPLSRFWWTIKDIDALNLEAHLSFVEKPETGFFGRPDTRVLKMRWELTPDWNNLGSQRVTVRWTTARNSQYLMTITAYMCLITDQLLNTLSGSIQANPGSGWTASRKPKSKTSKTGQSVSPTSKGSAPSTATSPPPLSSKYGQTTGKKFAFGSFMSTVPANGQAGSPVKLRPWPTPQDYNEAVQNPGLVFLDSELATAEAELNPLGMPKVASGAFASVYRMHCRGRDVAVRCFLKSISDQAYRYHELSKFILSDNLTYTVGFEFQLDGIKIQGERYPLLKMEWVEGEQLHIYVERVRSNNSEMEKLLNQFRRMVVDLRESGIAHGDLQHGNILVRNNEFFLVDYDGMFVPSLSGEHSNELGHANYQHPGRNPKHFGPFLDNFAAWVIDTSLYALMIDPQFWNINGAGDECLLFKRKDFINPSTSVIFERLRQHSYKELRMRAEFLAQLTDRPLDQVPWLGLDGSPISKPHSFHIASEIAGKDKAAVAVQAAPVPEETSSGGDSSQTEQERESKSKLAANPNLPDWLDDAEHL